MNWMALKGAIFSNKFPNRNKKSQHILNRTKQLLSLHGCQRRCYDRYLHVVQHYLANLLHTYNVQMTESDHKKAYQEYLKEKTFTAVVIFFDTIVICINKHVLNFANVALLCVAKSLGGV
jgi:hypothetical protein